MLIDNKTGLTKYYEYGRYDKEKLGIVRTGNIPDVVIGKDGKPTEKSLEKTLSAISEKFGDGGRIEGAYVDSDKFEKMNDYAKSKKNENSNKERKKYSLMKNNCGAFAADVLNQDSDVKKKSPSIIDPKPTSIVEEFQEKFKKIEYDPNKNKKNK